ncbi:family 1 glycosylhydrolase [Microbacterium invictum]|uniref:Beta-glucosidase n=1 Tax=Microbacterium invictum TaxID=515415 RepID=A0AA40VMV4_9MICO|nr:family 1 glycosylhydrolase [Microbacterium invictum]MBB4140821.1 beta-glucosidase [Microbacterium invictum]
METPTTFLWGASTAPHQTEGDNTASDWWYVENLEHSPIAEPSGSAVDSFHRYPEDMQLLSNSGLNAYRFGIEWARIEPVEGEFSEDALQHYRRVIETSLSLGLEPVVTLHHFSNPYWFTAAGGWGSDQAAQRFGRYIERIAPILEGVKWLVTINEGNLLAFISRMFQAVLDGDGDDSAKAGPTIATGIAAPEERIGRTVIAAHRVAVSVLRERTTAKIGMSLAIQNLTPEKGSEDVFPEIERLWENLYIDSLRGDDFIGVQSYTTQIVNAEGIVPAPEDPTNTQMGWRYEPEAIGIAVRSVWERGAHTPILVTENGIATSDDSVRIRFTRDAIRSVVEAVDDGVDVRGYMHWSAVDNYEWGHWAPTFGLIAIDRETFARSPRPSLAWFGRVARSSGRISKGLDAI